MKRTIALAIGTVALLGMASIPAQAVPILQVGVPTSTGYAPYVDDFPDEDTAFTSGDTIVVAGVRAQNANQDPTLQLGGQYNGGLDWNDIDSSLPDEFDGHGAILVVSVPDSYAGSNTTEFKIYIDGSPTAITSFYFSENSYFPNNHYPVQSNVADFFYFDIGNFAADETVPDFADGSGSAKGEIKEITFTTGSLSFDRIHFDVMAIETDDQRNSDIVSTIVNNPGSHDVTYRDGGGPPQAIPEPGTLLLVGTGLIGSGLGGRVLRRRRKS